MKLTGCVPVLVLRVLALLVHVAVLREVPLFPAQITLVCPHSADTRMFLAALRTYRVVRVITLITPVVPFLRVVLLLTLTRRISLPFVPPELFGTLGRVAVLALLVGLSILTGLRLLNNGLFFFLGLKNLRPGFLVLVDPVLCSNRPAHAVGYQGRRAASGADLFRYICPEHLHHSPDLLSLARYQLRAQAC